MAKKMHPYCREKRFGWCCNKIHNAMKRIYIRKNERFTPIGWICEECGNIVIDELDHITFPAKDRIQFLPGNQGVIVYKNNELIIRPYEEAEN